MPNLIQLFDELGVPVWVDSVELGNTKRRLLRTYTCHGKLVSQVGRTIEDRENALIHRENLFASLVHADDFQNHFKQNVLPTL